MLRLDLGDLEFGNLEFGDLNFSELKLKIEFREMERNWYRSVVCPSVCLMYHS